MLICRKTLIKTISITLLCFFSVTGCGSGSKNKYGLDKENPAAVEIWHYYNGVQKIEFDKMVDEFNKTKGKDEGIIVEAFNQGSIGEITDKILDTANKKVGTGKMPDAFLAYADTAYEANKLNLLSDYNKYMTKDELSKYIGNYIDEGKLKDDDELSIFPIAKSTEVLMVNKTDWEKFAKETNANIKEFETWEGIEDLAEQYYNWTDRKTEAPNDGKAFFGRDAMANYMITGSMELGEEIFKESDGKSEVNLNKEAFKKLWDNFYIPYIKGYYAAYGKFRSDDAKTGDIIALVGSTSGAEYFPDSVTTDNEQSYEIEPMILPLPKFKDTKGYMPQQGAGMVLVKSDSKHEYAVTEFLKWFTEADRNTEFSIKSGYLPVEKEANNIEFIKKKVNENVDLSVSKKSQEAIFTAVNQENTYEVYSSKAYSGTNKARDILEKSMIDKAKLDREEIKKQIVSGIPRDEVLKKYETDENFDTWFKQLSEDINKVI